MVYIRGKYCTFEKIKFKTDMASIRRLKKDIDYLTFAVIDDSVNCLAYGKTTEEIAEIVETAVTKRNELRGRVCAGKQVPKGERKAHYKSIGKDLLESVDEAFSKLSEMVKAKA